MIPNEVIEEILARTDIEQLISGYVTLKRAGSNMNGLCPFHSERINTMVTAVITASTGQSEIRMEQTVYDAMMGLRAYLTEHVYTNSLAKAEEGKAKELLISLYEHFIAYPEEMPALYLRILEKEGVARAVCDYISGMTDQYAIATYRALFIPEVWKGRNK